MIRKGLFGLLCAIGLSNTVAAQTITDPVARFEDWSVFEVSDPKECLAITGPTSTVVTRNGQVDPNAQRGDVRLYIFYRPSSAAKGQIAFTGGYPFAEGRPITMQVDSQSYQLTTQGEWAWPATPQDDATIAAAMRRGAKATVIGRSRRGATTTDEFSLTGFTAAMADAEKRCAG